jgi:hypothetical protein
MFTMASRGRPGSATMLAFCYHGERERERERESERNGCGVERWRGVMGRVSN